MNLPNKPKHPKNQLKHSIRDVKRYYEQIQRFNEITLKNKKNNESDVQIFQKIFSLTCLFVSFISIFMVISIMIEYSTILEDKKVNFSRKVDLFLKITMVVIFGSSLIEFFTCFTTITLFYTVKTEQTERLKIMTTVFPFIFLV